MISSSSLVPKNIFCNTQIESSWRKKRGELLPPPAPPSIRTLLNQNIQALTALVFFSQRKVHCRGAWVRQRRTTDARHIHGFRAGVQEELHRRTVRQRWPGPADQPYRGPGRADLAALRWDDERRRTAAGGVTEVWRRRHGRAACPRYIVRYLTTRDRADPVTKITRIPSPPARRTENRRNRGILSFYTAVVACYNFGLLPVFSIYINK